MSKWCGWGAGLLFVWHLAACGGEPTDSSQVAPPDTTSSAPAAVTFRGADVSALARIEQAGASFRNGAQTGDAVALLHTSGVNLFRLRLFVSPNGQDVQVNDLEYTVRLAIRVKASGAAFMLDLHFSDTWADPGHQLIPASWPAQPFDSLELQVESYVRDVMARLRREGVLPAFVQVGNEVDTGMLWPMGHVGGPDDVPAQWERFTRLLKAGVRGVRAGSVVGDSLRVVLHYSQGGDAIGTQWFFDHIAAAGVEYDVIGFSYYPWWHGSLANLEANLRQAESRFGRDLMVVETSYPWRSGGWEGFATNRGPMVWATTPAGQGQFVRDLRAVMARVPNRHGIGIVWWYPEAVVVPGLFVWGGGSVALFDDGGNMLPAATLLGTH